MLVLRVLVAQHELVDDLSDVLHAEGDRLADRGLDVLGIEGEPVARGDLDGPIRI